MTDRHTRRSEFQLRAAEDGDGLTLEGHAAVFNQPTEIRDWLGTYDEVISPGAFVRTLRARTPVMMFDHGTHPLVGEMPLGSIGDIREDDYGLFVSARLHDNWLIEPVRDAIRSGSLDGMSFQFSVPADGEDWIEPHERTDGGEQRLRVVREVKLFELGPVVFPAYPTTDVLVRAQSRFSPEEPDSGMSPGQRSFVLRGFQVA